MLLAIITVTTHHLHISGVNRQAEETVFGNGHVVMHVAMWLVFMR